MKTVTPKRLEAYEAERDRNRGAARLVKITIETRVPSKWRFVDQETGDIWRWEPGSSTFVRAELDVKSR